MNSHGSIWNVWRYIYRTKFLEENHILFLDQTKCEDVFFTAQAFLKSKMIAYFHNPYYCYRVRRDGALTTQIDHSFIFDFLTILQLTIKEISNAENDISTLLYKKVQREYVLNLANLKNVRKDERFSSEKDYKNSAWIIKNSKSILFRLLYIQIKYGGIRIASTLLYEIREIRRKGFWHIL